MHRDAGSARTDLQVARGAAQRSIHDLGIEFLCGGKGFAATAVKLLAGEIALSLAAPHSPRTERTVAGMETRPA
ncbi:MAG: hypothetical protein ACLR8Y_16880 [Alistipes indistinctus]